MAQNVVKFPLELGLELPQKETDKVLRQLKRDLRAGVKELLPQNVYKSEKVPAAQVRVVGKKQFRKGEELFEATMEATTSVPRMTKKGNIKADIAYRTSIRKINEATEKVVDENAKRLRDLVNSMRYQSKDVKKAAYEKHIKEFGDINNELQYRLEQASKEPVKKAVKVVDENAKRLRDFVKSIKHQPKDVQNVAIGDFIQKHGDINNELTSKLEKNTKDLRKARFTEVKNKIKGMKYKDARDAIEDYKKEPEALIDEADELGKALKSKFKSRKATASKKRHSALKTTLAGMDSIDDKIKYVEDYIKLEGMSPELKALSTQLSKQKASGVKADVKSKFNTWRKDLELLSPEKALEEIDKRISTLGPEFKNDALRERGKLERRIKLDKIRAAQDRKKRFADAALSFSSIGLGLLGPAGFPLLNVGFAAMSGGERGALGAGIATALGEGVRAIEAFVDSLENAAKNIGYVGVSSRIEEARLNAIDAFAGAGVTASNTVANRRRIEAWKNNAEGLTQGASNWTNIKNTLRLWFLTPQTKEDRERGTSLRETYNRQRQEAAKQLPIERAEALRSLYMQTMGGTAGVENDPYEVWKRIQTAALDVGKEEERRIAAETYKELKDLTDIARRGEAARANAAGNTEDTGWDFGFNFFPKIKLRKSPMPRF